jgi:hypothetical protein
MNTECEPTGVSPMVRVRAAQCWLTQNEMKISAGTPLNKDSASRYVSTIWISIINTRNIYSKSFTTPRIVTGRQCTDAESTSYVYCIKQKPIDEDCRGYWNNKGNGRPTTEQVSNLYATIPQMNGYQTGGRLVRRPFELCPVRPTSMVQNRFQRNLKKKSKTTTL